MIKRQTGTYDVRSGKNTFTRDQYFAGYEGINPTLQFETTGTQSAPAAAESNLKNRFLWGPQVDQLLADEQYGSTAGGASSPVAGPGNTLWALADHLGTIRDIADFDTAANPGIFSIVNHRVFDSFGNLTSQTSSSASTNIAFRYTGKYFDSLTGLSHHWNRWYDPKLGKWISEDPIGFAGGDTNLSRYVGNATLEFVDWNGLIAVEDDVKVILPSTEKGYWETGIPGNGKFIPKDPTLPIINYVNGFPDFGGHIYREGDVLASVIIDYSNNRDTDNRRANEEMAKLLGVDKWENQKSEWTWHHQKVDIDTGRGQMILIPKKVNDFYSHTGAFAVYKKALEVKAKGGDLSALKTTAKKLAWIGRKASGPVGLLFLGLTAKDGFANDGMKGAGIAVGRDIVMADQVEKLVLIAISPATKFADERINEADQDKTAVADSVYGIGVDPLKAPITRFRPN